MSDLRADASGKGDAQQRGGQPRGRPAPPARDKTSVPAVLAVRP
jgi:hypothetical protein